ERQRLAIEIPQASLATIGGAIATNVSGSRRFGQGTFRDHLIGIRNGDADPLRPRIDREYSARPRTGRKVCNIKGFDSFFSLHYVGRIADNLHESQENK
ncbi:MAG: hypothetical protein ABL984_15320, partial [Pyrinomonadaceae bacterium]